MTSIDVEAAADMPGCGRSLRRMIPHSGNLVSSTFMDYTAGSLPMFGLDETVTTTPANPVGAKGIGEARCIGATPAVLNAVSDALDGADIQIPVTPEQIWRHLPS